MGRGRIVGSGAVVVAFLAGAVGAHAQTSVPVEPTWLDATETELFTVGTLEGPEHEQFGAVEDVAFGPDGSLHVLDALGFRVVVFGPNGEFRRQFGREGEGPGEFLNPIAMAVDGRGTVWVGDLMDRGLERFDANGTPLGSIALPGDIGPDLPSLTASDDHALVLERTSRATNDSIPLYRVSASGVVDAAARLPIPFTPRMEQTGSMTFQRVRAPEFTPPTRAVALPGGGWAASHGTDYVITIDGAEPSRRVTSPLQPPEVTDAHREGRKEYWRERNRELAESPPRAVGGFRTQAAPEDQLEQHLAGLRFAEEHALVRGLLADPDGRIWIQRWGGDPAGPGPIDLVGADGRYLGTLRARMMPDAVGPDGRVAWIEEDEMGVPRVRVARLDLPEAGGG